MESTSDIVAIDLPIQFVLLKIKSAGFEAYQKSLYYLA